MEQWQIDTKHWALRLHAKARRQMDKESEDKQDE